jgi:hypothetical protein
MDSNARSTSWHDTITNNRGKQLEEYISSKQLHIMNDPSTKTTFENRIGKSNIDLTILTSNLLRRMTEWKISEEQSNSDHSIINYDSKTGDNHKNNNKIMEQKHKVNEGNKENTRRTVESMLVKQSNENREDDLDNKLYKRIIKDNHTEKQIEQFSEAMRIACDQSFKPKMAPGTLRKHKSVP